MTKVDHRAPVPRIDGAVRDRLTDAFDRAQVVALLLFGSQASGRASALSDVDLAVWLDPLTSRERRGELRRELTLAAVDALGTEEIDLVVLNDAPPLLRHRALKGGSQLLDRDPVARVRLETAALLDYLDTAPLRATLAEGRRRRIAEGRFGRR